VASLLGRRWPSLPLVWLWAYALAPLPVPGQDGWLTRWCIYADVCRRWSRATCFWPASAGAGAGWALPGKHFGICCSHSNMDGAAAGGGPIMPFADGGAMRWPLKRWNPKLGAGCQHIGWQAATGYVQHYAAVIMPHIRWGSICASPKRWARLADPSLSSQHSRARTQNIPSAILCPSVQCCRWRSTGRRLGDLCQ